ncbi:hypothetical protein EJ06DRAFT_233575 [Trichodelitschia bisporula]|uniref:CNH domain-containing protein n=1 Tax=Trichodelitschia bisporula TaxID=703511 RepID=A0A6G1HK70_9PEZI|nr:hypothetical protein EJ06DRAFT_233575 [Trichodelitschia bisporula]
MSGPPDAPTTTSLATGSFILRDLIKDVALSAEGEEGIRITCVEVWENNLYIGTSAGEILHHVYFPPDPNNPSDQPTYILASRSHPPTNQAGDVGIQQILLLPAVGKACILSSNTLTFYSLPELSPAFTELSAPYTRLRPLTCGWVGGIDLDAGEQENPDGVMIMMCLRNKIRLVKVGDEPVKIRDIEFGGCLATVRRGNVACVADARSYALVDVVHRQKIPLFSISSMDDQPAENAGTGMLAEEWSDMSRSGSPAMNSRLGVERGHGRSSSLGVFRSDDDKPSTRYGFDVPASLKQGTPRYPSQERRGSEGGRLGLLSKPLPPPPGESEAQPAPASASNLSLSVTPVPLPKNYVPLKPLIVSPNSSEFLLVTGTAPADPGVGMFVNMDGEVPRGTIEFSSYPEAVVVDGSGIDLAASQIEGEEQEPGYVLAVVRRDDAKAIEIQRWDVDQGEESVKKEWLEVGTAAESQSLGIRSVTMKRELEMPEMSQKLALTSMRLFDKPIESPSAAKRESDELEYIRRLCKVKTNLLLWTGDTVRWIVRNPMVLKLDARLTLGEGEAAVDPQRPLIETVVNDLRGVKSTTELEFFTLSYIRQKAATLLFVELILRTASGIIIFEREIRSTEDILVESELDPRVALIFLPKIREEILQGPDGIWLQGGLKGLIERFLQQNDIGALPDDPSGPFGDNILHLIKRYLLFWRRKKGNPSVTDGAHVFPTVDAALLRVLLLLDSKTRGPATAGSIRAELNGVVDGGVDCFERAIALLEQHKRLFILSRLYQSRKMSGKVLATWRRIIDGEEDLGGEFLDGENEMRRYLGKLRDRRLVEEYGTWLANRNPKLGVQLFADDGSRVTWSPADALHTLRARAPGAVKDYLEHLVFGKKQPQHINELISYYLDIVLNELTSSVESRAMLDATYETYRALRPPKPTYRQFIIDNAVPSEWWHSRLRLLQLLGGNQGAASSYDVLAILTRLQPFEKELVPEMIILNGRQGRHEEAIRLLTHGLGDFDMAISYCLRGGSSIFGTASDAVPREQASRDEQAKLFGFLLHEFLRIEDVGDRMERTGELLERFGGWFDVAYVLSLLPDSWSLEIFSGFLINALRRLVRERSETTMTKALSGAQNLKTSADFIERAQEIGPAVEA